MTKYRLRIIEDGCGRRVLVQRKFFLFWYYFRDAEGFPVEYKNELTALGAIRRKIKPRTVQTINVDTQQL